MSAGYLWRAALDDHVPQRVIAGAPALRVQLSVSPFAPLGRLRPGDHEAEKAEQTAKPKAEAASVGKSAAPAALVAFVPASTRSGHARKANRRAAKAKHHKQRHRPRPKPPPAPKPGPPAPPPPP